jgi:dihydroflavonol-4-reductase
MNLVTGATGFVGSHVARRLLERGEGVRALVRGAHHAYDALQGLPVERVTGDLRDPASLAAALRGVERVFHVAADYRLWARDPREIYESNVTGTKNLLAAARSSGVSKFIYTSSVCTMAVERPGALPNESIAVHLDEMIGHYKRSKYVAEQEALRAAWEGVPVVVVNPTTPVGPGDWKPTPTGKIILDFLRGKMPAYLDTGMNLVAVEDVATGHLLAAEHGKVGERYILGGENLTLKQILESLARITGRVAPSTQLPYAVAYAAGVVENSFARLLGREPRIPLEGVRMARHKMFVDAARAPRDLGFTAGPVEAALQRAVRWYTENGYLGASRAAVNVAALHAA